MKWYYKLKNVMNDNRGISTIELILILVVLVALVLVFKKQILNLTESIFKQINKSVKGIY